jgi:enoyl-CoA hydratase/carnithine racemase
MSDFKFPVQRKGAVARIDLGRPDEGNALTRDMMRSLSQLIRVQAADPAVSVVVLEAQGSHFCRGRDGRGESSAGLSPYEVRVQMMGAVLGVYEAINAAPIPVVAAVQGSAIGFGAALAGACDITIASRDAKFSFTEIKHGIPPTLAIAAVEKKMPNKALAYLIYSAAEISADEAVTFGLVSRTVPAAEVGTQVEVLTTELASRPRLVLETIKKFMANAQEMTQSQSAEYAGVLLALVRS